MKPQYSGGKGVGREKKGPRGEGSPMRDHRATKAACRDVSESSDDVAASNGECGEKGGEGRDENC
jgi:hypothetical protein